MDNDYGIHISGYFARYYLGKFDQDRTLFFFTGNYSFYREIIPKRPQDSRYWNIIIYPDI